MLSKTEDPAAIGDMRVRAKGGAISKSRSMRKSTPKRCSTSVSKQTDPVTTARVLAVSFQAGAEGWSRLFVSIHREIPANITNAALFGAIDCGAPQVSRIGMCNVQPIKAASPMAATDTAATEA
jgi:hypothetical protein